MGSTYLTTESLRTTAVGENGGGKTVGDARNEHNVSPCGLD